MRYLKNHNRNRLGALDGLRGLAALGVLWIHCWTVHGNPRLEIGGFEMTKLLALGGNGVDLFFVISGFSMFYFYSNSERFDYTHYWQFIKRRWLRLSPLFYSATLIYTLDDWVGNQSTASLQLLTSVFYLNSLSPYNAEGFFWSLSPEWQFYLLIPILFIYQQRFGFFKSFGITTLTMLFLSLISVYIFKARSDIFTLQIFFRFFEFAAGILVARLLLCGRETITNRPIWFVIFVGITYLGRAFLSSPILSLSTEYYNVFKLIGYILMPTGFGGIMYLALTSQNYLKKIFENQAFKLLGKISYSFYIWHGIVHIYISSLVGSTLKFSGIEGALTTFFISTILLLPLSYLSYRALEKPFFHLKTT